MCLYYCWLIEFEIFCLRNGIIKEKKKEKNLLFYTFWCEMFHTVIKYQRFTHDIKERVYSIK